MINPNFNLERELAERTPADWTFGALSEPSLVTIPESERLAYLPVGELQFDAKVDFTDCASRSPVNHLESLFTYHYHHAMKPENKAWMEAKGYLQNGMVTFSDRFIAVLSGTTHQGNSLKSPVDAIYSKGLIPKSLLPKEDWMGWDDYYNLAAITPALIDLGKEFLKHFTINYEQVAQINFEEVLKDDMLGVAGFAWNPPIDGVYHSSSTFFNHAFLVYSLPKYQVYDNYLDNNTQGDFTKNLAPDYTLYDYGYRVYISAEAVAPAQVHLFLKNLGFQVNDPEVTYLQKALVSLGYPIPHAVTDLYGVETRSAVMAFQRDHGIVDDGSHFGPKTRYEMNKTIDPAPFGGSLLTFIQSLFSGV